MKGISVLFMSLFVVTLALAEETAVQKYRNYTPQQIKNLPEKEISASIPIMYTWAAQRGISPGSDLLFGMQLNRLMYPGLHDYSAAVKAFQLDLGDKPTGVLTVWQIHSLGQRSELQSLSRVLFPDQFYSSKTDDYASIQGTMIIIDEQIAWPINHVKVKCYKNQNYCQLDQIQVSVPDDKSFSQNYQVQENDPEYYNVSRWGRDSIDAEPKEIGMGCRTTSMNLNFKTKEFYYTTRNAGGNCEVLGTTLPKLPKPRIAQIVDGSEIIRKEFAKFEKAAYDVLASDFRKQVDEVSTKEDKK